jgi:hypothetical protein
MGQKAVDLVVPADLADILIDEGLARPTFERRSSTIMILAESASIASTAISLLQGPSTVMQVARGIKRWTQQHRKTEPGSDELTIAPNKHVDVRVIDADTDIAIIVAILQKAVTTKDDPKPPEDFDGLTI